MTRLLWPVLLAAGIGSAGAADPLILPAPHLQGGMPLMEALKARHSTRAFATRALPPALLSDLLWAAAGINRADSGKRTAPSARDAREIAVYVVTARAAYLYEPAGHRLRPVVEGDLRGRTGSQDFVATAPVNLVYVADPGRLDADPASRALYAGADAGVIAENVYLFCASAGLATVVRGSVDRPALAAALRLAPGQEVVLAQTVGYPE
ncbi:SagB/ThcOx family dehydrogenase [Parasulfuritortus cantonensis]|uniref:SagB/ThcOx family dehydrogenase n=1 Tax=Parasulfuritortus cantonensis TaxID=2528202 RepID=A0A4R1B2N8_9PROT|nr:SagB/ThcOx family dehydrogenase [Parasulfuritortus cantonensis]TCJ12332.1 SagB/ThcOx family dehydrogenase [Parasulfuritortus cantonensis]